MCFSVQILFDTTALIRLIHSTGTTSIDENSCNQANACSDTMGTYGSNYAQQSLYYNIPYSPEKMFAFFHF